MEVDSVTDEVLSAKTKDPYKSEGQITLKLEKLSEFAHEGPKSRLSDPVYIRGLPWKILAIPQEMFSHPAESRRQTCLGYFLQCNHGDEDPSWSCSAKATLKILAQKPGKENYVRKVTHVFSAKELNWGFPQFMTFEDIMNPEEGWYDSKADTIVLFVDIKADPPHGVKIDEERIKSLQQIKEKEKAFQINNFAINLEELENLKKKKDENDKKLIEKLKENKELYERLTQNAMAIMLEENIKLKNEKLKYEEEIEKIKSKVENLEEEKKSALGFIKIKEKELEEEKKKVEELIILNKNLVSKFNEIKTENNNLNEMLENQSKGFQQLKDVFGSIDGHMNKKFKKF